MSILEKIIQKIKNTIKSWFEKYSQRYLRTHLPFFAKVVKGVNRWSRIITKWKLQLKSGNFRVC